MPPLPGSGNTGYIFMRCNEEAHHTLSAHYGYLSLALGRLGSLSKHIDLEHGLRVSKLIGNVNGGVVPHIPTQAI